ncbi:capsule biosynthesis protein [Marinobacter flavimaris]|uniref:Capsule biosynthesis protein n=2 Tax=Marinobacter flavimaris TaxID=262076 RepID=A0A3D8H7M0_9GAMM|nr:capsule biosynthesis protein [Marinobacter flavimaris]RDU42401.1 capsule biosynthesis protein [Marinobacter flavimaris]
MKIGLTNLFSFRPHVEHLEFLAQVLENEGHEVVFLTCDSAVETCYIRELRGRSRIRECAQCIVGGVRSYRSKGVTSIGKERSDLGQAELEMLALSSSATLTRTESELEWEEPDVREVRDRLADPISQVYHSARNWILQEGLEGVICFNGRMDLPRAVTYACEQLDIPYITHERTWFGDGIQLIPKGNCLSLRALSELVREFDNKPLTASQAAYAGKLIGDRFLQRNSLEWRLYNKNPEPAPWPVKAPGKRVLVLPSSKNEFAGHDEWRTEWADNTEALDDFFEAFRIDPSQVVLRCHPNWAETIGRVQGSRSLNLYTEWAGRRGIHCIRSEEKANTYDLIQQADIVVLNGGSSAVEAGACGKQVVCLGPSTYQEAGFVHVFRSREELRDGRGELNLDPELVRRKTLRFLYVRSHRFPQFVPYVKAVETTKYRYFKGARAEVLIRMLSEGRIRPDDPEFSETASTEDGVLAALERADWSRLADYQAPLEVGVPFEINRRAGLKWIDGFRAKFARGDRAG